MAIPAEAADDVVAGHREKSSNDIFDGAGQYVAIVWEARGEWRTVIEDVLRQALSASQLSFERLDFGPQLENGVLLLGEGEVFALADFLH